MNDDFQQYEKEFSEERKKFFQSLTKDQQLLVFCEVVHKLYKAEIIEKKSYRGVLYGEFGFDKNAYLLAQISNFLELHNSIVSEEENNNLTNLMQKILNSYGIYPVQEEIKEKLATLQQKETEKVEENIQTSTKKMI
jgi:hypothetical protein